MTGSLMQARSLSLQLAGRWLFRELEFSLEEGDSIGILGPNGAGKSSLLRCLAGLMEQNRGDVTLFDKALTTYSNRELAKHLGLLFQFSEHAFPASVFECALAGRHPHIDPLGMETGRDLDITMKSLEKMELEDFAERDIRSLSGGEQQRLAIATLLTQEPSIALLDEPNNHLDLGRQIPLLSLLQEHFTRNGQGLIMVLHDINLALRFCNKLLLLSGDGQWRFGESHELATSETLGRLFGHPLVEMNQNGRKVFLPA